MTLIFNNTTMKTIASWEIYKKPGETRSGTIARLCRELAKEKKVPAGKKINKDSPKDFLE